MKDLIKKILKEEFDDFDWVEGIKQFSPAEEFLYEIMSNLTMIPSEKYPGWMLYKDKSGTTLMVDNVDRNEKNPYLLVDYDEIWSKLRQEFGLNGQETKDLCVRILEMTYKRKVLTTFYRSITPLHGWR